MGDLRQIALVDIRENPVALRAVNRQDENYLGLVESIKTKGFMGAITVRAKTDPETKASFYELVDGLHRFCAAKDAGLNAINVDVVSLEDDAVLEAQLMANVHKIETRPVEYSKQLLRILSRNPLMTEVELANRLGKSAQWIRERLGLTKISNKDIAELVNEGKIGLANAYALAKLPPDEMADFVDRAMTLAPDEFIPAANSRLKELREAKRQGKDADQAVFQPVAFMQKMKDVKDELDKGIVATALCQGLSTPAEGFKTAIQWMLHLDSRSVEVQKGKEDARRKQREEAKQKRLVETADKKAERAKKAAEEAEKAKAALVGGQK
jgi:ParB/RepB/Spo0J family partition protein